MFIAALVGLFAGLMGGKYGAKASAGFAKNLREGMYNNIQTLDLITHQYLDQISGDFSRFPLQDLTNGISDPIEA